MNENRIEYTIRYRSPSNKEAAPYATFCKVITTYSMNEREIETLYIQTSRDENKPCWMTVGDFLIESLGDLIFNKYFMNICLTLLNDKTLHIKLKEKDESK